ncbi:MAG: CBS domain-containing protein [Rhodoferax sp.]|nr:CBS domain-containing protein [Rhodoferax sp.]
MKLDTFLIPANASLRAALLQIEANHHGFILTTDQAGAVVGLATDGDIRRKLLEGASLDAPISASAHAEFVWADSNAPREMLLKKLDHRIKVIPLLDVSRLLTGIISRDRLPIQGEEPVYARARSPVRISFGGGGSDLTHYFEGDRGAVISTAISLYSHATLRVRDDDKIIIQSRDLGETLYADSLAEALKNTGRFGLIQALLKAIHPNFGVELYLHSDFPMSSGLGGSAVVSAAVLGCFNQFRRDQWDLHELAEIAYQAERLYLGVAGGWQDQYATVFGGFNFMEFRMDQNVVHPLRIHSDTLLELEESLILCDTGTTHDSGDIHQDQRQRMQHDDVRLQVKTNVDLTYRMRDQLLRGRLLEFGQSLHEAWQFKRQFSSKISTKRLDEIYDQALQHGAIGGKLLGAGGGGFFILYVPPYRKHELMDNLEQKGLKLRPFRFEADGLRAWTGRERKNHLEAKFS